LRVMGDGTAPHEIVDLRLHQQLRHTRMAASHLGIRYVYGIPLRAESAYLLGVLCVFDRGTRQLSIRERRGLEMIAGKITDQLATSRRTSRGRPPAPDVSRIANRVAGRRTIGRKPPAAADVSRIADHVTTGRRSIGRKPPAAPDIVHVEQRDRAENPDGAPIVAIRKAIPAVLQSKDVAALFAVTERSVSNWAKGNRLASFRTPGGHLRFRREDVLALYGRDW
jgi:hypothetical protein